MSHYYAGLDLGSTSMKLLLIGADGGEHVVQVPTPWVGGAGGTTSIRASDVDATVRELLNRAVAVLAPNDRVVALAAAGMGETGFLVGPSGEALAPGYAWFDPRGAEQVSALPASLRTDFAGRTGLPWGVQVSAAKILHMRDEGYLQREARWVNLPEWAVATLGGRLVSEYSLASRTGLLDQQTGQPWGELLDYIGVDPSFLPTLTDAGTHLGTADAHWMPDTFRGAALTVAGHDHLVAAVSGGAKRDAYHVSMGTAEVLLRVLDNPLTFEARQRLGDALINCVRHVRPGEYVLVAGVKTGLIMRRLLQMLGISDRAGRDELDRRVLSLDGSALASDSIQVTGARNDDGVLKIAVRTDGVSPEELFLAVLQHGNDEIQILTEAIDREVPAASSTLLTGGWAEMGSVRRARAAVLPHIHTSERSQETASGAVLFARQLSATTDSI